MDRTKFRRTRRFSASYISLVPMLLLLALAFLQMDPYKAIAKTTKATVVKAAPAKRAIAPAKPMLIKPSAVMEAMGDPVLCSRASCAGSLYCPDAGALIMMIDGCCARCCWESDTGNCSEQGCCGGAQLEE